MRLLMLLEQTMRELLAEVNAALQAGRPCVYCAVVETRGSTPQKAGAAMLVFPDGGQVGTLGGGCVEAEVRLRALQALQANSGRAEVRTFHLDDIQGWDDGLICGGRMTILLHPLTAGSDAASYYRRLQDFAMLGRGFTEAVVLADADGLTSGDRYLFDADGALAARCGPTAPCVAANLIPLSARPRPPRGTEWPTFLYCLASRSFWWAAATSARRRPVSPPRSASTSGFSTTVSHRLIASAFHRQPTPGRRHRPDAGVLGAGTDASIFTP